MALLEEIGIDGEWVTSGEEAVNLVAARYEKENDYFAIIIDWKCREWTDWRRPGRSGK